MRKKSGASITWLLLIFNLLLVFLPIAAFLSLESYEKSLLSSLEHALSQQCRFLAVWLSGMELDEKSARAVLSALNRQHTARIRILDAQGMLLADSATLWPGDNEQKVAQKTDTALEYRQEKPKTDPRLSWLYRLYSIPVRLYRRFILPPQPELEVADFFTTEESFLRGAEVQRALDGGYGSATRISSGGQISVTLYSALPIKGPEDIEAKGVVLLSQSTFRILTELYQLRVHVGKIFLWSLGAALAMTLLLSLAVLRPVRALSRHAREALTPSGLKERPFPTLMRADEIGELSRALGEFSQRLKDRLSWAERFSQDAAHELKNPIAAIRSSAELLDQAQGDEGQALSAVILEESRRMERIISGLRSLSRLDFDAGKTEAVEILPLARNVARRHSERSARQIDFRVDGHCLSARARIDPDRLVLALDTLIDNALSLTPQDKALWVEFSLRGREACLSVIDEGPGVEETVRLKIFERFFSYRPNSSPGEQHAGLGLSIAQAVAQGAGGRIVCEAGPEGTGSAFRIYLPLLDS